jgi:hypothetical protein
MTLLPLVVLALQTAPAEQPYAFGAPTTAPVKSVRPDADAHRGDGAYGRFRGDLDLGFGVGPKLAFTGDDPGIAVRGTAFWFSTFGLDLVYEETLKDRPVLERRFGVGAQLRPLFLLRWSQALEKGPAVLDLALDSLGLGVGASFATPEGRAFASRTAFEATFNCGIPLAGVGPGPWLEFRAGLTVPHPDRGDAGAMLVLSWHFALLTPIVNGD